MKSTHILKFGFLLLILFFILTIYVTVFHKELLQPLLSITATNIIFGRMAGLSIGIASQIDALTLILFNFYIESIMVLILYPIFAMSWDNLEKVSYTPLKEFLQKSHKSAIKHEPTIKKYGSIGLIIFVLTPFAMTGPVVGSFVGFLLGFSHMKTLITVLLSTLFAIIMWLFIIKNFEDNLVFYGDIVVNSLLIAAGVAVAVYLLKRYTNKTT